MSRLLENLETVDSLLKAQITRGGNSKRKDWSGGKSEDQSIPGVAPNGTDYSPSKDIAHKAVGDMSNEELEYYLNMRKSQKPNPRAAEAEIEALPGVTKSLCDVCGGVGSLHKSICGNCSGHGVVFEVSDPSQHAIIKSIVDKYNLSKANDLGDASTTPKKMPKYENEKEDHTGKAAKSKGDCDDEDDISKGKKAKKGDLDDVPDFLKPSKKKDKDEDFDEDFDEDSMKSVKKSLEYISESLITILKSQESIIDEVSHHRQILNGSQQSISKSMGGYEAARAPKSVNASNVHVLNKSFAQDAPGFQDGGPKYDLETIKKGASAMALNKSLSTMEVLRLDSGAPVDERVFKSIEEYIDSVGVENL
jgi:hypothetical protein